MTFIDTNYFLRFLLQDNTDQLITVKSLFLSGAKGEEELFTSTIVFFEVSWVLSSVYSMKKADILKALRAILNLSFIRLNERDFIVKAITLYARENFSLADCYNLAFAHEQKAQTFATFDKQLQKEFKRV